MRIGEEFFQRIAPRRRIHVRVHERAEIGFGGQVLDLRQGRRLLRFRGTGGRRLRRRRFLHRFALLGFQARPAIEKRLLALAHRLMRSLGWTNERGLTRFFGSGR
ncbi:hypothetical protein D3C83_59150 [compost metagenome]